MEIDGWKTDGHSVFAATEHDVIASGGDGGGIDGTFRLVELEDVEGLGVEETGGLIPAGRDEHSLVLRELEVGDGVSVGIVDEIDRFHARRPQIELRDQPAIVACKRRGGGINNTVAIKMNRVSYSILLLFSIPIR